MANKRRLVGMLVLTLVFGMTVVGCGTLFGGKGPTSFSTGSGGETTILLRQGLDFDQAFREAIFVLSRHGFEPEMMNNEAGYIRTRWSTTWFISGKTRDWYKVRILISFNPGRTQMLVSAPAEYTSDGKTWISGYDTRAIETLRTDLTQSIGN